MPIFEYRCKECGATFEALVFSSSSDEIECENCGSKETEKLMSTFASTGTGSSSAGVSGGCSSGSPFT